MSGQWFCVVGGGEQQGPYDQAQIESFIGDGSIGADDLLWREGMAHWAPARSAFPQAFQQAATAVEEGSDEYDLAPAAPAPMRAASAGAALRASPAGVRDDPGPFLKLSATAVASPTAIYIVRMPNEAGGGGLVGALLVAAFSSQDDKRTCSVSELPSAVRVALDPRKRLSDQNAIVVRKDSVRRVRAGKINNAITVYVGDDRFSIATGIFSLGKVKRFLGEHGWPLNREVVPTAAPVHGEGYGRPQVAATSGPGLALRILYVVLAVGLLVGVVALRVACDDSAGRPY